MLMVLLICQGRYPRTDIPITQSTGQPLLPSGEKAKPPTDCTPPGKRGKGLIAFMR